MLPPQEKYMDKTTPAWFDISFDRLLFQVSNSSGSDMNTCQTETSKQYLEIAYNHGKNH